MTNRVRPVEEKVESVTIAFRQINVEAAAREAGVPASTLRYDLDKVKEALPATLANRKPGPKAEPETRAESKERVETVELICPECGGKVTKNGTYWV
ncbi:MAG: hypothetical protein ACK2UA_06585, partial [Anaerolineae bacterium]